MSLGIRKVVVISLIALVFLAGNILVVANWLAEKGVEEKAQWLRQEFLTGTTVAITVILLILLVGPKSSNGRILGISRRCPVCDRKITDKGDYCSHCGSKI